MKLKNITIQVDSKGQAEQLQHYAAKCFSGDFEQVDSTGLTFNVSAFPHEFDDFCEDNCPQYHTPVSGEGFFFHSKKECIENHSNPVNLDMMKGFTEKDWQGINLKKHHKLERLAEVIWEAHRPRSFHTGLATL